MAWSGEDWSYANSPPRPGSYIGKSPVGEVTVLSYPRPWGRSFGVLFVASSLDVLEMLRLRKPACAHAA